MRAALRLFLRLLQQVCGPETSLRFGLRPASCFAGSQGLGRAPSARFALLGRGDGVNVIAFGCIIHLA